jgi:hypothetical protein
VVHFTKWLYHKVDLSHHSYPQHPCVARINSGIPQIESEQWSSLSPGRKLKLSGKSHRISFTLYHKVDSLMWISGWIPNSTHPFGDIKERLCKRAQCLKYLLIYMIDFMVLWHRWWCNYSRAKWLTGWWHNIRMALSEKAVYHTVHTNMTGFKLQK